MSKMPISEYVTPFILLRSPLKSIDFLLNHLSVLSEMNQEKQGDSIIKIFLNDPLLMESVFIGSPILHSELVKAKETENISRKDLDKLAKTLMKYLIRLSTRSTPFGLFATVSTGEVTDADKFITSEEIVKIFRIDMDYLCALSDYLSNKGDIKKTLVYYPNSSLYRTKSGYRYVEYRYNYKSRKSHHLVDVEDTDILRKIISFTNKGALYSDLINHLLSIYEIDLDELTKYIDDLIKNKLLESSLQPNVTGEDYLHRIVTVLKEASTRTGVEFIELEILLQAEKIMLLEASIETYELLYDTLKQIPIHIDKSRFLQVDCLREGNVEISRKTLNEITSNFGTLSLLNNQNSQTSGYLEQFKSLFSQRYEHRTVKLSDALDPKIGIGYGTTLEKVMPHSASRWDTSKFEKFVIDIYLEFLSNPEAGEIRLTDDKILGNFKKETSKQPKSFCLALNFLEKDGQDLISFSMMTNSATNLFGRFCYLDSKLLSGVLKLTEQEQANYPDAKLAEIAHLPQSRIGNVVSRPRLRSSEISYLAYAPYNKATYRLDELYIKLEGNELLLLSKTGERIIPKLSNAHNYSSNSLPVYNFLCDLQNQGNRVPFFWNWGVLSTEKFLPRVVYKNILITKATWNLRKKEVLKILDENWDKFEKHIQQIKEFYQLPEKVVYSEGDNTLVLDLKITYCVSILKELLSKYSNCRLTEFLYEGQKGLTSRVRGETDQKYANEIIIPFVEKENDHNGSAISKEWKAYQNSRVQRLFLPGSEWVYLKIYSNEFLVDELLLCLFPLIEKWMKSGQLLKWFFVRYADPKPHIRVRFLLSHADSTFSIVQAINKKLKRYFLQESIYSMSVESYTRELERYGFATMDTAEEVFSIESSFIMKLLRDEKKGLNTSRIHNSMFIITKLLDLVGLSLHDKLTFCSTRSEGYLHEQGYSSDKNKILMLDKSYRSMRSDLDLVMSKNLLMQKKYFTTYLQYLEKCLEKIISVTGPFSNGNTALKNIVESFIHMFVNRYFDSNQRLMEMHIYYYLSKYLRSIIARKTESVSVQSR